VIDELLHSRTAAILPPDGWRTQALSRQLEFVILVGVVSAAGPTISTY
jgi:hypothetical protein